ncbi:MAG: DUF3391 domain-containing protein [Betaproteobacteria bacterium]|nr:DUF3391 domain-containing protein [Betaproteobacteria bacterium]
MDKTNQSAHYASPDQLRIGLYVFVDLPWFRHPFTLNSFRISSEEQIRELRALKEDRFRYDPQRSETPSGDASPAGIVESREPRVGDRVAG